MSHTAHAQNAPAAEFNTHIKASAPLVLSFSTCIVLDYLVTLSKNNNFSKLGVFLQLIPSLVTLLKLSKACFLHV